MDAGAEPAYPTVLLVLTRLAQCLAFAPIAAFACLMLGHCAHDVLQGHATVVTAMAVTFTACLAATTGDIILGPSRG